MNFFKSLDEMLNGAELQLNIKKKGDQLTVMIMPKAEIKDKAIDNIKPLVITGTPVELDLDFLSAIKDKIEKATGIMTNIATFEAGVAKLSKDNEVDKKKAELEKKEKDTRNKKYATLMGKYESFKKEKKLKEAIGALKAAKAFTDKPETVEKMINETIAKLSQGSIFGTDPIEEDTTDYLADFKEEGAAEDELTEDDNDNQEEEA